jgi:hypothetical protein
MPSTRREKDFVSWKCWVVGLEKVASSWEMTKGSAAETTVKMPKVGESD